MDAPWIGGVLAFLFGAAVSAVNYALNRHALKTRPSSLASLSVVRQLLNVGALAAAFFLSRVLPWGSTPLLVGTALGLTVPSVLFSLRLAKENDALSQPPQSSSEKGDDHHG